MEKRQEVFGQDVFMLLQVTVQGFDVEAAKEDQRHPGRRKFVGDLVDYMDEYFRMNRIAKPDGYKMTLKAVASSRTDLVIGMMEACKTNDGARFAQLARDLDNETLRRLGEKTEAPAHQPGRDLPAYLREVTAQDIGNIMATGKDVRRIAGENRKRSGLN